MTSPSLKQQLRLLMAEFGLQSVNEAVHDILHEDYVYLQGLFGGNLVVAKKSEAVSTVEEGEHSAPAPAPSESTMKKVRVRVMKSKVEEPVPAAAPAVSEGEVAQLVPEPLNIIVPLPSTAASSTVSTPLSQPQVQRSAQDIKKFQKLAEETKRRELKEKGVTVEQVLTKENLQKWIVEEKHTFAWVAREKAGCPETQVSSLAKSFGIQSPISIRRGLLVSKRNP